MLLNLNSFLHVPRFFLNYLLVTAYCNQSGSYIKNIKLHCVWFFFSVQPAPETPETSSSFFQVVISYWRSKLKSQQRSHLWSLKKSVFCGSFSTPEWQSRRIKAENCFTFLQDSKFCSSSQLQFKIRHSKVNLRANKWNKISGNYKGMR